MPKFINKQTGAEVEFVGAAADWARESGQYDTPTGSFETTLGGAPVSLPASAPEFANRAVGPAAGPEQRLADEATAFGEQMHGGAGSQALAFGEGVASGLTFGATDVGLNALGAETKQRAAVNTKTRLAGELTGIVGASVVPGLSSGALGKVLAKTPAGFLSAKTTQLGNAIGGVKGLAAAQALEGAGYAVGQTASQLFITDEPLSAEAMWAQLGKSAAFGAGAGAAGGLVLGSLGKGYKAIKAARASAPVVNLATTEGRAVAKSISDALAEVETVADMAAATVPATVPTQAAKAADAVADFRAPLVRDVAPPTSTPPPADILPVNAAPSVPVARAAKVEPVAAVAPDFGSRFDEVYDNLRQSKPFDMVELSELRAKFPELSADDFNKSLRGLRKDRKYLLEGFEGRHGTLSEADKAAAITEDGRQFIYAQRAADYTPAPKPAATETAPTEVPPGFTMRYAEDGPIYDRDAVVKAGVPRHEDLVTDPRVPARRDAYVVRPSELAQREIHGFVDDLRPTKSASVEQAWAEGKDLPGLQIDVHPDGSLFLADGNHRLMAAAKSDRPVLVQFVPRSARPTSTSAKPIGKAIAASRAAPALSGADDLTSRIDAVFDELDPHGNNLVSIPKLRQKFPDVPREQFDAAINDLRRAKHFSADQSDGRHVRFSPEELDGQLRDGTDVPKMWLSRRGGRLGAPAVADEAADAAGGTELQDALRTYQFFGGNTINPGLRSGARQFDIDAAKAAKKGIGKVPDYDTLTRSLDEGIAGTALPADTVAYRGVKADLPGWRNAKPGDVLPSDPAYGSTSSRIESAAEFGGRDGYIVEMRLPAGSKALPVKSGAKLDKIDEMLLPRGMQYRVVGVRDGVPVQATFDNVPAPRRIIEVEPIYPGAAASPEVAPAAQVAPASQAASDTMPAPQSAEVQLPQSTALSEYRVAQEQVRMLLGTTGSVRPDHVVKLLTMAPDVARPQLEAIDEYFAAAKKLATEAGDTRALDGIAKAEAAIGEAASAATGGASAGNGLADVAIGLGLYEAGDTVGGPVGDLAKAAAGAKLAKVGARSTGAGFLRRVASGTARAMGGRTANKIFPGGSGMMRGVAGYQVGSKAFGTLFDTIVGQRAVAGVTHNSVGRIAAAFENAGRSAAATAGHGQLAVSNLIRETRFDYGQRDEKPARKDLQAAYRDRLDELAAVAASPVAAQQAAYDHLEELRKVAPYVADELEMLAVAVPQFLYDKAPKDPGTMTRMGKSTWKPPEYEIRQWGEYVRGALAPVETIEGAMQGKISPQAAESVRTLFPNLFKQAQTFLVENMEALQNKADLQTRTRLSVLFDVPLDSTMHPEFRGFIAEQNMLRQQAAAATKPRGSSGGGSSNPGALTGAQKLLA